jgi:ankyrin repeat protein
MKLLEAGASVKDLLKDEDGRTLLHKAARKSQLQVLDYLVKCYVNLNDVDNQGETALHHGVMYGTIDVVKTLLEAGAKINVKSEEYKFTPLHYALLRRDDRIIELLLEYKANPNDEDYNGRTAMAYAHNPDIVKKLQQAIDNLSLEDNGD